MLAGSQLRGRLDLTPGKLYTLSPATGELLQGLDDVLTIKWFQSSELPPEVTAISRDVDDLLRDFDAAGGANVNLVRLNPGDDPDVRADARQLGIDAVQFNVIGQDEFSVREGYLGLALQYAGESDAIPLVRQTADLEYRLASMIRSMTREERPTVAMLEGHGELDPRQEMRLANGRLSQEYNVRQFSLDSTTVAVPSSIDVLVIAGGQAPLEPATGQIIGRYLDEGGSLMVLRSGVQVEMQSLFAGPLFDPVLDSLLQSRGLGIVPSMAYDVSSHEQVQFSSGLGRVVLPYPLWILSLPASEHTIVNGVSYVPLRYPSPLLIEVEDSTRVTPLLTTTELGGRLQAPISVQPEQDWEAVISRENFTTEILAVAYADPADGRIVLAGSSSFIHDDVLQGSQAGMAGMIFFQNGIDWLAQDEALISIRSKDRSPPQLLFESELQRDASRYGNLIGVPLLFVLFGVLRMARRRRGQKRVFEEGGALI